MSLATDLRGLRSQRAEAQALYESEVSRIARLEGEVEACGARFGVAIDVALAKAASTKAMSREFLSALREGLALVDEEEREWVDEEEDVQASREALEAQARRSELSVERFESEAAMEAREASALAQATARLEKHSEAARKEAAELETRGVMAARDAERIEAILARRGLSGEQQPRSSPRCDLARVRDLERAVQRRRAAAHLAAWRQLVAARRFRERRVWRRLAGDAVSRWRRLAAASSLAEMFAARASSRRAVRAWRGYAARAASGRAARARCLAACRAIDARRTGRRALAAWARARGALRRRQRVASWHAAKLRAALDEFRYEAPVAERNRKVLLLPHEEEEENAERPVLLRAAERLRVAVSRVAERRALRAAVFGWAMRARTLRRRREALAAGLGALIRFRAAATRSRRLDLEAIRFRARRGLRLWAAASRRRRETPPRAVLRLALKRLRQHARRAERARVAQAAARLWRSRTSRSRGLRAWRAVVDRGRATALAATAARLERCRIFASQEESVAAMEATRAAEAATAARAAATASALESARTELENGRRAIAAARAAREGCLKVRRGDDDRAAAVAAAMAAHNAEIGRLDSARRETERLRTECRELAAAHARAVALDERESARREAAALELARTLDAATSDKARFEAELRAARDSELGVASRRDDLKTEAARLEQHLDAAKADAKRLVADQRADLRRQYDANAEAQIKLAKRKSTLSRRIREMTAKVDDPSDHLCNSLLLALQAKRKLLFHHHKKDIPSEPDDDDDDDDDRDRDILDAARFPDVDDLFANLGDPPLPPLPPLRDPPPQRPTDQRPRRRHSRPRSLL